MSEQPLCKRCDSTGWVCENHNDRPWGEGSDADNACSCGAGEPCPDCNTPPDDGSAPRFLAGSHLLWDRERGGLN